VGEAIPDPSLVILVGPSGSGKSTWAANRFRPEEIVSSDRLRAMAGSGEHDLDASEVAFDLLDRIVASRLQRGLLTVVDTLGLDDERRTRHLEQARQANVPAVIVVFDTPEAEVRARNRARSRPVPERALTSQIRRYRQIRPRLDEAPNLVVAADQRIEPQHSAGAVVAASKQRRQPRSLRFYLQISRFPSDNLAAWVSSLALAAEGSGFAGVAVMDHLVQIPQVGREWEPMPEAYITLSYLAGLTSNLELGALVTGVTLRNPALLAKMIATLDVMSGGRAFCGLGAGWHGAELLSYGYPFPPARERVGALADTLAILPLMWAPGKATYRGTYHSVEEAVSYPRPIQESVRIVVGGRAERIIRLATEHADGLNLSNARGIEHSLALVRKGLEAAGRSADSFEVSVLDAPLVATSRSEVASMVEAHRGTRPHTEFAGRHHAGLTEAHIGRYRELADLGVKAVFVAPVGVTTSSSLEAWKEVTAAFAEE
jgi:alkanesulfonate monooxygenase SsuD/methylene tetrahydromethanopterin reductase-like flavin-dependent oxidoreductase (luciferase family)/predicted kinase